MPDITPEIKKYIDGKLEPVLNIERKVDAIHQFVLGLGGHGGAAKQLEDHESRIDDHEKRIVAVENDHAGKVETKKVIGLVLVSLFGGGGLISGIVFFILNFF